MANPAVQSPWRYKSAWDGVVAAGTIGSPHGRKIKVTTLEAFGAALIIAGPGGEEQLAGTMKAANGLAPPPPGRIATGPSFDLIWAGPAKWLAVSPDFTIAASLQKVLQGVAAVSDHSGSYGLLAISGEKARDMFAKGLALDLHPRKFKPGDAALPVIAHINVHIWQTDEVPSFKLVVPRSMAASFWAWLVHAGSEFGLDVHPVTPAPSKSNCGA
jgi:methylglutamate dehydrogenase subunit D